MEKILQQIIKQKYDIEVDPKVSRPDPQFGDYATNVALQIAKPLGKNPREVAEVISSELEKTGQFSKVEIAGPGFINLTISAKNIANQLFEEFNKGDFGKNQDGVGKIAVVDYPSPNMAKPYSVGHLRPGNQGWAAKKLLEATGWKVITDNHLGDYGAPFGIWVAGFKRFSSHDALEKDGVYELGRVYIATKKALKDEAEANGSELADEVQEWLLKLENKDPEAVEFSRLFNEISLNHIHNVMGRLKISTDYEYGEAFFAPKGKEEVQKLLSSGVAVQNDDGSVIVPLDEYGFNTPLLIQKSNGAALYATTDLATIKFREQEWNPDKVVYAVGMEQQFYFSQLFAMADKIGVKTDMYHLTFGVIDQLNEDGTREKMSSRKGVVLMEELLDKAEEKARELTSGRDISDDDIKKIALGAIKFSDFIADRRTNILFDWNTIFALTGMSGPYIQYAAVRIAKILNDIKNPGVDYIKYDFESEKAVILKLLEYPEVVKNAASSLEPHKVANYLYDLAREMNRYYENVRIAESSDKEKSARLDILNKVLYVFDRGLDLLGIEVPSQM